MRHLWSMDSATMGRIFYIQVHSKFMGLLWSALWFYLWRLFMRMSLLMVRGLAGITGCPLQAYIFMGPIYYQKLKHMVGCHVSFLIFNEIFVKLLIFWSLKAVNSIISLLSSVIHNFSSSNLLSYSFICLKWILINIILSHLKCRRQLVSRPK